jgi:YHS domain-containing protein
MMKSRLVFGAVAAMLVAGGSVMAGDVDLEGVKCVLNPKGAAKATSSAEYKGATVYFCCDSCKAKFTEEPTKYAAAANAQLVATKQAKQVNCPLMGKPAKDAIAVTVAGVEVNLCCAGCKKKVEGKEGADQVELVFNDKAFQKGFEMAKKQDK